MTRSHKKIRILILFVALLVLVGAGAFVLLSRSNASLPSDIHSQLTFSPFVATASKDLAISEYRLTKAENTVQTLSYVIDIKSTRVVVNQSVQPSQFTDVPEYKERFLSDVVNRTSTVQTANGVIYLGKTDADNRQIAVMIERGLLLFFNPSSELPDETWRTIGDSLTIEKTTK